MSTAVAEIPVAPSAAGWPQRLAHMEPGARLRWGGLLALAVLVALAAFFYSRQPDYKVLFAGLSDKDGGAIVAQLAQMNMPYKYTEGGGAILVPAERVHDVRLRLASQGLPKGSVAGFELTESARFGTTQFQERLNFQRGLEGELTRSIQALSAVHSARVHLALPNQNGFFREQQKPSASVLVSLYPGRALESAQLAGIVHLVAASVPEMAPGAVSVIDDSGKLLSRTGEGAAGGGVDVQQLAYAQRIEQEYQRRIVEILEPVVGRGNVRAQVAAEVDFSQTDSTSEQHRPNLAPDASAVRSQQVVESPGEGGARAPSGVPGAVSNQPPQGASAPVNGANPAPSAAGMGAQGGAAGQGGKRESVTNYEVDKTTRVTRGSAGTLKRVNAAVVINDVMKPAEGGKGAPTPALSAEQLAQMTALVRETIGFNQERGDSVNLVKAPFVEQVLPAQGELPLWRQPEVLEMARSLGWPLGISLALALVLIALVRPALKARAAGARAGARAGPGQAQAMGGQLDAIASEPLERPALPAPVAQKDQAPTTEQLRLEDARALARDNPLAVASILKGWVSGD